MSAKAFAIVMAVVALLSALVIGMHTRPGVHVLRKTLHAIH